MANNMIKRETAGGIVLNVNGEVLLVLQKNGSWTFPKGGVDVEDKEESLAAAKREIFEETGLAGKDLEQVGGFEVIYERPEMGREDVIQRIAMGHSVTSMRTSYGSFAIEPDIFLGIEARTVSKIKDPNNIGLLMEGPTSIKSPAMPTITATAVGAGVANSQWSTTGSGGAVAGLYHYRVQARNQYGTSTASVAAGDTVVATGSITVAITPGQGAYAATCYEIFREATPSSGVYLYCTTVTAAAATYSDLNAWLPGTSRAVLVDNTTAGELRTMAFSQLAPIHSVEYGIIGPYRWGAVNLYGVPKWYTPLRYVMFKNIGVPAATQSTIIDL